MNALPINIEDAVNRYEPITSKDGIVLWPVKVKEYRNFLMARPALEVMHQSLPVTMMRIPLLSAYYEMDYEARLNGQPITGLFAFALLGLALSLRLGEGESTEERIKRFQIIVNRDNPAQLVQLQFTDDDGQEKHIDPASYKELRRIIAAQNGVRVESDTANPNIVQARKDMNAGGAKLDYSINALISFAAAVCGADETDIYEWPILKLQRRTDAYQNMLAYLVCGIGEASGASWKNGNPHPHPIFQRLDDGGGLATAMKSGGKNNTAVGVQTIEAQIKQNQHH